MFKLVFFLSLLILSTSCKRRGCTDNEATNYDSKAEFGDGTCIFESKGIIYWDSISNNNMISSGITQLTIVFDHDTLFTNRDINSFGPFDLPDCMNNDWFKFDRIVYEDGFEVGFMLLDQNQDTVYGEFVKLNPACNIYEIEIN